MKISPTTMTSRKVGASATSTQTYPIRLLLDRLIYDHDQSPARFVTKLGYGDLEQGVQKLDSWLASGNGSSEFIDRVAAVYPAVEIELRLAVAATMFIQTVAASDCDSGIPKLKEEER